MTDQPFIQYQNITKSFAKNVILDNISLDINYGEIFGVIGKSGSGKSTMLNILIGFLKPDKGQIIYQSRDISRDLKSVQQQFGFAAQEGSFYPKLTVYENLEYFGKMYNISSLELKERIPKVLHLVELENAQHLLGYKLSSGMQKRLDIACALINDPKVLILDEPTEDLDPMLRYDILDLIKKISKEKNVTVVVTSHLLNEVEYFCNRVAILDNRHIIASGNINELKDKYSKFQEVSIELESKNYDKLMKSYKRKRSIKKIVEREGKIYLYTNKGELLLKEILNNLSRRKMKYIEVSLSKPSLQEVFEELIKKNVQVTRSS